MSPAERDRITFARGRFTRAEKQAFQDEAEAEERYVREREQEADEAYRLRFVPVRLTSWQRFVRWIDLTVFGGY